MVGMRRSSVLLGLATALALGLVGPAAYGGHSGDKDCGDFATQEEAQAHLEAHQGDPDGLDGDKDGIACESLPSAGGARAGAEETAKTGSVARSLGAVGFGTIALGSLLLLFVRRREFRLSR